jgi:hypothetical protein
MADEVDNAIEDDARQESVVAPSSPSNLPFIITLMALLIYFAFQTLQLLVERSNLSMVKSNQDAALQEAQKVQGQFKILITKTNELAEKGHAGARMVMEGLQRQGFGSAPEKPPASQSETKPSKQ